MGCPRPLRHRVWEYANAFLVGIIGVGAGDILAKCLVPGSDFAEMCFRAAGLAIALKSYEAVAPVAGAPAAESRSSYQPGLD